MCSQIKQRLKYKHPSFLIINLIGAIYNQMITVNQTSDPVTCLLTNNREMLKVVADMLNN